MLCSGGDTHHRGTLRCAGGYDIGYENGAGEYIHYFFVIPVALTSASLCDA